MSITKNCMIVNLQLGIWTGQRLDRVASAKVTEDAGAESDAARVNKHLIAKDKLKPISAAAGQIRLFFYDQTLPWKDNGDRLLTRLGYTPFIQRFGELKSIYEGEVIEFLKTTYPTERERAAFRMGDLFNPEDYPAPRKLRDKFYVNLDIDPVAEAGDFRVSIDKAEQKRIQQEIETNTEARIAKAMVHTWNRLATTLGHFRERMAKTDSVFKDATINNLNELVELLPALNVTGDPDLAAIAERIRVNVLGHTPQDLRADTKARKNVATEARKIMDDIGGFMKAFENAA